MKREKEVDERNEKKCFRSTLRLLNERTNKQKTVKLRVLCSSLDTGPHSPHTQISKQTLLAVHQQPV